MEKTISILAFVLVFIFINMFFLLLPSIVFKRNIRRKRSEDEKLEIFNDWQYLRIEKTILYSLIFIILGIVSFWINKTGIVGGDENYSLFISFCIGVPIMQYFQIKNLYIKNYKIPILKTFFVYSFVVIVSALVGGFFESYLRSY